MLMIGPSRILHFPDSLALMAIGLCIGGIMFAHQFIPCLPEMVDSAQIRFPGKERQVNAMSAGVYNSVLGCGYLVGPIYGGMCYQYLGFRTTMDLTAGLDLLFAIMYFICCDGFGAFKITYMKWKFKDTEQLWEIKSED